MGLQLGRGSTVSPSLQLKEKLRKTRAYYPPQSHLSVFKHSESFVQMQGLSLGEGLASNRKQGQQAVPSPAVSQAHGAGVRTPPGTSPACSLSPQCHYHRQRCAGVFVLLHTRGKSFLKFFILNSFFLNVCDTYSS